MCTFLYIQKGKKMRNFFRYKKQDNLRYDFIHKKHHTLRYAIFHENFEVGIFIQKTWHFALRDILIYKTPDNSKKSRQFALRFYTKIVTLCVTRFFIKVLKLAEEGGGILICPKKCTLSYIFIRKKQCTLYYIFYIEKS